MHVLHLTVPFEYACGISRHVWCLARAQAATHRVTVATSGGAALELLTHDGLPWLPVRIDPARKGLLSTVDSIQRLRAYSRREKVSVIHVHHRYHALLGRVVSLLTGGIPVVATCHYISDGLPRISYPVARIIAVSHATKRFLTRDLGIPEGRITVVPHCLPPPLPVTDAIDARIAATSRPLVVGVGRLSIEKGFDVLIRAMALLRGHVAEPLGVVVGDGPMRGELESLAHAIGSPIVFTGAVRGAAPYFDRAAVVVQPSLEETASLTALEAGAAGRAVIVTAVGGLPEIIRDGDSGVIVPPNNPEALAAAIAALLTDAGLRARLGAALQRSVAPRLDPGSMVDAVWEVYQAAGVSRHA